MSGHCWIILAVDHITRNAETRAVTSSSASEVTHFLLHQILLRHHASHVIVSNHGTPFASKLFQDLLRLARTVYNIATAHNPQTIVLMKDLTILWQK